MRSLTTKSHVRWCIVLYALFIFPMFLAACGSGSITFDEAYPDMGSIAFNIVWQGASGVSQQTVLKSMVMERSIILDCQGTGVTTVEAHVYDQDDNLLKDGGPWDCTLGSGTIRGVPAGSNRKVVILAWDADENIVYQGEKSDIIVIAGATNDVGTIMALAFSPMSLGIRPDDRSITLSWADVAAATSYNIYWSTDPSVSKDSFDGIISEIEIPLYTNIEIHSYIHEEITNGTTYYYVITSENEYGESRESIKVWSTPTWRVRLLGTTGDDYGYGIAMDTEGNCYITGYTDGDLNDHEDISNAGGFDIVIAKYDKKGNKVWSRLLGTPGNDYSNDITMDTEGNCYITGYTDGTFEGHNNAGGFDIVIAKYDKEGKELWFKLLGTIGIDYGCGIAVDTEGNCYIIGYTDGDLDDHEDISNAGGFDIVIAKYDAKGNPLWSRLLGSQDHDYVQGGIAVDASGNCYITGYSWGDLDGHTNTGPDGTNDIIIAKYDTDGTKLWSRLLGSLNKDSMNKDYGWGIAVDAMGNCYITGDTFGDLDGHTNTGPDGTSDIIIAKYDTDGTRLWSRSLGSLGNERGYDIVVDDTGNCYIAGSTYGDLDGHVNAGLYGTTDIVIAKYDTDGTKLWSRLFGSTNFDVGLDITLDTAGNCYVTGRTEGNLDDKTNIGDNDIFIAKFDAGEQWEKLLGTADEDVGYDIAVDTAGNCYITGWTSGDFDDYDNAGSDDIVIAKYETNGNPLWSSLLGSSGNDHGYGIDVDVMGNCYITGYTYGSLDDNINAGSTDIFIAKYDTTGDKLWSHLFGSENRDYGQDIAVDVTGNCYITGFTERYLDGNTTKGSFDIVIAKYDTKGNKLWSSLLGSSGNDHGYGIDVDIMGNCYITGYTYGDLDGHTKAGPDDTTDIVVAKYDTDGTKLWSCLLGSEKNDRSHNIVVDIEGNCYITGYTDGIFEEGQTNAGGSDIVIAKYDKNGNKLWSRLLGSADDDYGHRITVDTSGNCYITGETHGDLDGHSNAGSVDILIAEYDTNGNKLWFRLLGSKHNDYGYGIALDSEANCYVTGDSDGPLAGNTKPGGKDIFIWKSMTRDM